MCGMRVPKHPIRQATFGKTIRMEMVAQEGEGLFKVSEGGNHRINHSQPALAP